MEKHDTPVTGRLKRILFEREDFKICQFFVRSRAGLPEQLVRKIDASDHKGITITAKGYNFPSKDGMTYNLYGTWAEDPKYGWGLNLSYAELQKPSDDAGLIKYLSSSMFSGIGKKKAEMLVKAYHSQVFDVLENHPEKLTSIKGFNKEIIRQMRDTYLKNKVYTDLSNFLMPFGVKQGAILKIHNSYGARAIKVVKHDPFALLNNVRGIGFDTCDKIATSLNIALNSPLRIKAVILYTVKKLCNMEGGMYVESRHMYAEVCRMLNSDGVTVSRQEIGSVYKALVRDHSLIERHVIVKTGDRKERITAVFLKEYDDAERIVSDKLISLSRAENYQFYRKDVEKMIDEYDSKQPYKLHPTQRQAVLNSILSNCSIITGGPGTGKTTILRCIIYVWKKLTSAKITCMAPTGKAARRMEESTGVKSTTIHRKLHLCQEDIEDATAKKIASGLVVIDEMSMVDNLLMKKLMEAVSDECHIIMVGDIDQLPSVGPGAVLEQMIKSNGVTYTKLTFTFRQDPANGGAIIDNALKINNGNSDLIYDDFFQLVQANTEEEAIQKIKELYVEEVKHWGIDNVALLSPLRSTQNGKHMCSSDGLNPLLQNLCNPKTTQPSIKYGSTEFRLNDRVMKWANGKLSSNGDIGVVTGILEDENNNPIVRITWESGITEDFEKEQLEDVTLAYSMSVHKSQGSEYNSVIIPVLSCQRCPLFKRNLLYTGVTRAKKKVILVGDSAAVRAMCIATDNSIRNSVLKTRLEIKSISGISGKKFSSKIDDK